MSVKPKAARKRSKPAAAQPSALMVVNLADLGPRPKWANVMGFFGSLNPEQRGVLLHWLVFHLGCARTEHEADPLAPEMFVAHARGRSAEVNRLLNEAQAMMHPANEPPPVLAAMRKHFDDVPL